VNFDDVQISFKLTRTNVPLFIPATSKKDSRSQDGSATA
jgi:hypothetical protein